MGWWTFETSIRRTRYARTAHAPAGCTFACAPRGLLLQNIARQPMARLGEAVIVGPQRVASVMLRAGQMQGIRGLQSEARAQLRGQQIGRIGQGSVR